MKKIEKYQKARAEFEKKAGEPCPNATGILSQHSFYAENDENGNEMECISCHLRFRYIDKLEA